MKLCEVLNCSTLLTLWEQVWFRTGWPFTADALCTSTATVANADTFVKQMSESLPRDVLLGSVTLHLAFVAVSGGGGNAAEHEATPLARLFASGSAENRAHVQEPAAASGVPELAAAQV